MNKFKKLIFIIIALLVVLPAAIFAGSCSLDAGNPSLGEIFDPSGNPFVNRFSDVKDIRTATVVVAASDSKNKFEADFYCDGTSDEDQINDALTAASAAAQGRVKLLDGTFTIDDPIIYPGNNLVLEGEGRATLIDGDGLATTEHAIVIDTRDHCTVRNLSIQTQNGGGKTCHCIYLNKPDYVVVEKVIFVDSDSDALRIEGGGNYCVFRDNKILGADDAGIREDNSGTLYESEVLSNIIRDTGDEGIYLERGLECIVSQNIVEMPGGDFIRIGGAAVTEHTRVTDNLCLWSDGAGYGIRLTHCSFCLVAGNGMEYIRQHGIFLENASPGNIVEGNEVLFPDEWGTASWDGIYLDADSDDNIVANNNVFSGGRNGISILGDTCQVVHNYAQYNWEHGIVIGGTYCAVEGNFAFNNGQNALNTYDGIHLQASADQCNLVGNVCTDLTDGSGMQRDGIHLADGCSRANIAGNHCSWGKGDGIHLEANNDDCSITGNYCFSNSGHGINLAAATCDKNFVQGNKLIDNVTGALSDSGTLTTIRDDNQGINTIEVKHYAYAKNTSGGALAAGDVVSLKAVAAGNEVTTPAAIGEAIVYGMVAEATANNAWGYVQVKGYTTVLKATNVGGGAIVIGDLLCTEVGVRARKIGAGHTVFARALEDGDAADLVLDAFINSPWD